MRVAVVHDWLVDGGGAERVTRELADLFQADLFALVDLLPSAERTQLLDGRVARTTWVQHLPFARRHFRWYLPLFPKAIRSLDLSAYDLVISSSYAVAKGVRIRAGQKHICYLHTPMRYAWVDPEGYLRDHGVTGLRARFVRWQLDRFKRWDLATNSSVHRFVANGEEVAARVRKYYGRDADKVLPPVDGTVFTLSKGPRHGYLSVSRLVQYKRVDMIIRAFNQLPDLPLTVVGEGPDEARLKRMAAPHIRFTGRVRDVELAKLYRSSQALVCAAREDLGITPLEAQACGTPVIALRNGGYLHTVDTQHGGKFFETCDADPIVAAVLGHEVASNDLAPHLLRAHASMAFRERFRERMQAIAQEVMRDA